MSNPYSRFLITDGTTDDSGHLHAVSLLNGENGLCITDWSMRVAETKGGGVWADSALADGRFLKLSKLANVQETLTISVSDFDADALADDLHLLYDLLEKARNWGPSGWSSEPVWIEAVGVNETNVRYALVHDYRTVGSGNPFAQPFWQSVPRSSIDEFEIVLEREPAWRGNYPGDADCVELSAMQEMCTIYPLVFNGTTSVVAIAAAAKLDDRPAGGAITVEAWVYADGWGEGNLGHIADKSNNSTLGWRFWIDSVNGLCAQVYRDTQHAISYSGLDEWGTSQLGGWHHVVFVYVGSTIYLYIDGTQVTSYPIQQVGIGAYLADNAHQMRIGNNALGNRTWDGSIGWVRFTINNRYGADFDAPPRCPLPVADPPLTVWLGIHEGTGSTIYDLATAPANGTVSNGTWGDCCLSVTYGNYDPVDEEREGTCAAETVFVANKHNTVGLTHILVEDGGVFGANLLAGDPPYSLLPAVPAANDRIYFGIQSTLADAGPFSSLVFDLSQAQANIANIVWEYWNGGWVALTVQDNTNADGAATGAAFDTTGVKSVHWAQPSDWAATAVNGITALWVRAEVQDAGTQPPIQQNRHIYTILWPFVEIQADELGGNIPALARIFLHNQSDNTAGTRLSYNRVLIGLRSVDRGELYSPYINLTDRATQNYAVFDASTRVAVSVAGTGTFGNDQSAETGRVINVTNPGAAWARCSTVNLPGLIGIAYSGTFRLFLRASQTSGVAGDVKLRILANRYTGSAVTIASALFVSPEVAFGTVNSWQLLDFGEIAVDARYGSFSPTIQFQIEVYGNGASDARLYTLILFPVDEWAIDAVDPYNEAGSCAGDRNSGLVSGELLNIDRVTDPRRWHSTVHFDSNEITVDWQGIAPEGPILLPNTRQRLWFLSARYPSTATDEQRSQPWVAGSVQAWANERYLLMRGDK